MRPIDRLASAMHAYGCSQLDMRQYDGHSMDVMSDMFIRGECFIPDECLVAVNIWLYVLAQTLQACAWSGATLAAMRAQEWHAPGIFGLRPSSLVATVLERGAPRFAKWAVRRGSRESDLEPDQKRMRQFMKHRATMDYTITLRPEAGTFEPLWVGAGDSLPGSSFLGSVRRGRSGAWL